MFKFEKLEVWQKSIDLYAWVTELTIKLPRSEWTFTDQIRRAALSVPTNIAEATGRQGSQESKHFFNIAKGSVYEVVSLLASGQRIGLLTDNHSSEGYKRCDEIARMLSGLLR